MKAKRREKRIKADHVTETRIYVFARERNVCRICRFRPADSMHELRPRSLGGKVSRQNSVAVCGDVVNGCHGFAQRYEIGYDARPEGAESTLFFVAATPRAAEHLRIKVGQKIVSPVMAETERDA